MNTLAPTGGSAPERAIYNENDLHAFLSSRTKDDFVKFILASGQSCATATESNDNDNNNDGTNMLMTLPPPVHSAPAAALSPAISCWIGALRGIKEWLVELPPIWTNVEVRFGNPVFKQWHQRLLERAPHIMTIVLKQIEDHPPCDDDYNIDLLRQCEEQGRQAALGNMEETSVTRTPAAVIELCAYLQDAFGHCIRLDYGTGHESSFQITLYALFQMGAHGNLATSPPTKRRLKACTILVWTAYLNVVRGLQQEYRLEPAGSHGVWGLDDYHCLPFYYGAQQLVPVPGAMPSDIYKSQLEYYNYYSVSSSNNNNNNHHNSVDDDVEDEYRFLYFSCINFIRQLKSRAPFHETSPMLHDISGLPSWAKLSAGLLKLYQGEVLSKLPVVQHWVFGTHFPATWTPSQAHPAEPPTETFRTVPGTMPPPTRAPWAK